MHIYFHMTRFIQHSMLNRLIEQHNLQMYRKIKIAFRFRFCADSKVNNVTAGNLLVIEARFPIIQRAQKNYSYRVFQKLKSFFKGSFTDPSNKTSLRTPAFLAGYKLMDTARRFTGYSYAWYRAP